MKMIIEDFLAKLATLGPAKTSEDIYVFIEQHREWAKIKLGKMFDLFEYCFDELNIIIQYLNYVPKENWNKQKSTQYLIIPETMKTLHRSIEDALDGYYDESIMLNRSVYETLIRVVFLSCYPDEWEAVFIERKNKMRFEVTGFVKDHLKVHWHWQYQLMCCVAHSKIYNHLSRIKEINEDPVKGTVFLKYSKDFTALSAAMNISLFNLCALVHILVSIFEKDFENYDNLEKRKDNIHEIDESLRSLIQLNERQNFKLLAKDIEKVGMIIRSAESGNDWKMIA